MARGPFWLGSDLKLIRANLDKTDAEIAAMLPGRKPRAVADVRRKLGIAKVGVQERDPLGRFLSERVSA